MTDIFKEAEQELQREKLYLMARKHRKGVIAVIAIIVITIFFSLYLRGKRISEQQELSKEYYNLFLAGNNTNRIKEGDFGKLITFEKSIYAKFAKLQYVNSLVMDKKYVKAIQLLLNVIEVANKEPQIANLAKIKVTGLAMKYKIGEYNEKILDILRKTIRKAKKQDNVPYLHMIKLLLGQFLIELNQKDEGLNILEGLSKDEKTPNNIKFFSDAILENYLR